MDCTDLARLLPAFADGEFEDEDRTEVEIHLAHCDTCRAEVASQTTFRNIVKARALTSTAPAALRRRIEQDLARERLRAQAMRFVTYSAVAAGLVVVASAGFVVAMNRAPRQTARQIADEILRNTNRELRPDVLAASADPTGLDSFVRRNVDFAVSVPRFRSPDAPQIMGARLMNVRNHDAAEFMYGNDPQRRTNLVVFSGPDIDLEGNERIGNREVLHLNRNGYHVVIWEKSKIYYSLVSPLDESDVRRLIQEVEDR